MACSYSTAKLVGFIRIGGRIRLGEDNKHHRAGEVCLGIRGIGAGNADCVVTDDNDPLLLEQFGDVDIILPSDFAQYEAESAVR